MYHQDFKPYPPDKLVSINFGEKFSVFIIWYSKLFSEFCYQTLLLLKKKQQNIQIWLVEPLCQELNNEEVNTQEMASAWALKARNMAL